MYYVYLLHGQKVDKFYIGSTGDLRERLNQHNQGHNTATIFGIPWTLVYYEAYLEKVLAVERERRLKHYGRGLVELKKRIGFF